MHKIIEDLHWRYAVKKFDPNKKINSADIETILESLRLVPTSYGLQAYKVLLIENPEVREKLVEVSWGQRQVAEASHLIVLCAYTSISEEDVGKYMQLVSATRNVPLEKLTGFSNMINSTVKNRTLEELVNWTSKQTYIALGQLIHTCASMRIDCVPMEGFLADKYDEILGLEAQNLTATLACPIGYRHQDDPNLKNRKVRKSTKDLIQKI